MKEILILAVWPTAGAILYILGRRLSKKSVLHSFKFFAFSTSLLLLFIVFLFLVAPPSHIPISNSLMVKVLSVDGMEGCILPVYANNLEEIVIPSFNITIKVVEGYDGKPVSGAAVVVSGAGTMASGKTGKDGVVTLQIQNAILGENLTREYMGIEDAAPGYNKYVEKDAIILVRIYE